MTTSKSKDVVSRFEKLAIKAGLGEKEVSALRGRGYFEAPASKGHHLAYPGGLIEHSVNVAEKLVELTEVFKIKWTRPEGPYLVGLLHDLVKCDCYKIVFDQTGPVSPEGWYPFVIKWCGDKCGDGHGFVSLCVCDDLKIKLMDDEKKAILFHMGRFGVGKEFLESDYREVLEKYGPQVLATHFADWWSSEVVEKKISVG